MSLNRSEKQAVIDEVTGLAAKAQTLVMAEYRGITVADMTKLRSQARDKGVTLSVLKNTLARRAVAGSAFDIVSDQMTGPLIYGFSIDAVAAAKAVELPLLLPCCCSCEPADCGGGCAAGCLPGGAGAQGVPLAGSHTR